MRIEEDHCPTAAGWTDGWMALLKGGEIEGSSSRGEGAGDAKGWHPQGPILNCSGHRGSAPWNRVGRCNHRLDEASTSRQLAGGHADPERAKDSR